ncbi:MAG: hypothetical protein ACOCR6_03380 [archaeon]
MGDGYSVDGPDLSGEVELEDGETVVIPRPDNVFPVFGEIEASADVYIEDGRIRIREEDDCVVRLGVANKSIEAPDGAVATIHAGISKGRGNDQIYSEIALDSVEEMKMLRNSLDLALRYRGGADE